MSRRKKRCPYVIKSTGEQCNHDRDHQGDWCHTEAGARFRRGYMPPKARKVDAVELEQNVVTSGDLDVGEPDALLNRADTDAG